MIAALIAIVAFAVLAGLYRLANAALANNRDRNRIIGQDARHARHLHTDTVAQILADFNAERLRWEQERTTLLNRIADPAATAFSSTVAMLPPAGDMSMEVTR